MVMVVRIKTAPNMAFTALLPEFAIYNINNMGDNTYFNYIITTRVNGGDTVGDEITDRQYKSYHLNGGDWDMYDNPQYKPLAFTHKDKSRVAVYIDDIINGQVYAEEI